MTAQTTDKKETSSENANEVFFQQYIEKNRNDFDDNQRNKEKRKLAEGIIDNANKYFLIEILSPEITENESKKENIKTS